MSSLQSAHTLDDQYLCPGVATTAGCAACKSGHPSGQNGPVSIQQPQKGGAVPPKPQIYPPTSPGEMQPASRAERGPSGRRAHQYHIGNVSVIAVQ